MAKNFSLSLQDFALRGNAVFTIVSSKTGEHFTYKVQTPKKPGGTALGFVSVLRGGTQEYAFIGSLFPEGDNGVVFRHSPKSPVGVDAPSVKTFGWLWKKREEVDHPNFHSQILHEGMCCRCGRPLTNPESIAAGIGPDCAGR